MIISLIEPAVSVVRRIMQIARPVQYSLLVDKIKQYYGEELLINYTLASAEVSGRAVSRLTSLITVSLRSL